jgi:hypothetical protein
MNAAPPSCRHAMKRMRSRWHAEGGVDALLDQAFDEGVSGKACRHGRLAAFVMRAIVNQAFEPQG